MKVLRMLGVSVSSEGACCNVVTREVVMIGGRGPNGPAGHDLLAASDNSTLSEEMRAKFEEHLRKYPEIDFVLVTGELPDRDYIAEYLASKFPDTLVQVARGVGESAEDLFRALDAKFYRLVDDVADIVVPPPRDAGLAANKS